MLAKVLDIIGNILNIDVIVNDPAIKLNSGYIISNHFGCFFFFFSSYIYVIIPCIVNITGPIDAEYAPRTIIDRNPAKFDIEFCTKNFFFSFDLILVIRNIPFIIDNIYPDLYPHAIVLFLKEIFYLLTEFSTTYLRLFLHKYYYFFDCKYFSSIGNP